MEIKYKAWDKKRKAWCDEATIMSNGCWSVFHHDTEEQINSQDKNAHRIEFVLSTGRKDKNNVEAYQKDYIKCEAIDADGHTHILQGTIEWDEEECGFVVWTKGSNWPVVAMRFVTQFEIINDPKGK